jgi:hypothetical protein
MKNQTEKFDALSITTVGLFIAYVALSFWLA